MDIILDKCQGESLLAQRNFILNETISPIVEQLLIVDEFNIVMGQLSSHVFIVIQPDHLVKSTIFYSCKSIRKLLFAFLIDKSFKINYYPIHIKLFFKQKFRYYQGKRSFHFTSPSC